MTRWLRGLLAALVLLASGLGGTGALAAGRLIPQPADAGFANLPSDTLAMPGAMTWATNCREPLTAGNLQQGAANPRAWRFVVFSGDIPPGDVGRIPARSRCEWSGSAMKVSYGPVYWQVFSQRIGCFSVTASRQLYFGQWHAADDDSDVSPSHPIWAIRQDTATRIRVTYSGSIDDNTTIVDSTAYTDNSFVCGQWYDWVFRSVFSKTGAGELSVWRRIAGGSWIQVVNLTGINMGYNDVAGPYWKWGYYGYDDPATVTVDYANQEFPTTTDLSGRVTEGAWPHPK